MPKKLGDSAVRAAVMAVPCPLHPLPLKDFGVVGSVLFGGFPGGNVGASCVPPWPKQPPDALWEGKEFKGSGVPLVPIGRYLGAVVADTFG